MNNTVKKAISGSDMRLRVHTEPFTSITDGEPLIGVRESTITELVEMLDVSYFGHDHKEQKGGLRGGTIDFSGSLRLDTGFDMLKPGSEFYLLVSIEGQNFSQYARVIVESREIKAAVDGILEFSSTIHKQEDFKLLT